jgi:flagellin
MISIQTNVTSMIAQNNLNTNAAFQNNTIEQLTSGYRINSSSDDAAGLAVANKYRSDTAELTQGVRNAADGTSQLQIIDGGLTNISQMLDRMKTLATESASTTFTGDRNTLQAEYGTLQGEIDRQASNIGLNASDATGGTNLQNVHVYVGGGSDQTNAQVSFDLSSSNVNQTGLGVVGTSLVGGNYVSDTAAGGVNLNAGTTFLTSDSETFTFSNIAGNANTVALTVAGGTNGLTGAQVVSNLNGQLSQYGISASTDANGKLQFTSTSAFSVAIAASAGGATDVVGGTAIGTAAATKSATSGTGNALAALTSIESAVQTLGTVQGTVGAAENQLNYATSLANSQITNYSAAESNIRDTDVAAQAANLSKAQVLQQASIAAMAQANSSTQAVLSLLKG